MNIFDTIYEVERNGQIWRLHWKNRYDPLAIAISAAVVGTGIQVAGTLEEGRQTAQIRQARAAIDIENAEAVREAAVEEARIEREKGIRFKATQRAQAAAGGIRINVGAPLVIAAETEAVISKEIGFILQGGRVEEEAFRESARIEIATGKAAKKQSRLSALSQGLLGITNIALLGAKPSAAPTLKGTPRSPIRTGTFGGAGNFPQSAFRR